MKKIIVKTVISIAVPFIMYAIFSFVAGSSEWVTALDGEHMGARFFYVVVNVVSIVIVWGGEYLV